MIEIKELHYEIKGITLKNLVFNNIEDLVTLLDILGEDIVKEKVIEEKVIEEKVDENIEIENITKKLNDTDLSPNTKKKYISCITNINTSFDIKTSTQAILFYLKEKYDNNNTRKLYYSALMYVYKLYNLTEQYDMVYNVFNEAKKEVTAEKETKPIEDAENIMNDLKVKYEELKTNITDKYDEYRIYSAVACLFLNHGVLRGAELINMYISPDELCETLNYIDLKNKQMIIADHKTAKKTGKRIIDLSDEFIDLVKEYPNRYFIVNQRLEPYKDSSGLSKKMLKYLGFKNYVFRKAKSSINLKSIDEKLCAIQGHSIDTQISNYRDYS